MAPTSRPRSQVSPRTIWTVGLNVLALVLLLGLVRQVGQVLAWVMVALFIALAAHPVVAWLQRRGLRRGLAVLGVFLCGLALIATLVVTFVPMVYEQVRALVVAAPGFLDRLQHQAWVQRLDERFDIIERVSTALRQELPGAALPVLSVVQTVLLRVASFITVAVLSAFFLAFGPQLFDTTLEWVRPGEREHWRQLARRMLRSVGGYVAGAFLVSFIGGAVTTVTTLLLGVPYFLPLGLGMALLGLIPFLGSALGAVLVVGTTFATAGTHAGFISLAVFVGYQQVENHLLQPFIQRHTLRMNPLLIALAMLVGTAWAGIVGALLALPVAGALQVVAQDALARRQARWRGMQLELEAPPPPPERTVIPPPYHDGPEARH
jgi:predicted PurR-regulated permease PerM